MATRNRATRGEDQKEFVGKVRKWKKAWIPAGRDIKDQKLKLYKWIPIGNNQPKEQTPKKYASIVPVPNPNMVQKLPLLRPAQLKVKLKVGGKAADSPAGAPAPSNTTNPNPGLASPLPGTFGR